MCGHCGCSLSAQIKRERYVYYHSPAFAGSAANRTYGEEVLDECFSEILGELRIDSEILGWLQDALRSSHEDERRFHDAAIRHLQEEHAGLQRRLDAMYVDKLDGRIDFETFERLSVEWRSEQARVTRALESHQHANGKYFTTGVELLSLVNRAQALYAQQPSTEKRKLLNYCTFELRLEGRDC